MERGRRNAVSRADAAKSKLAELAAAKVSGKKRVETFEVKREEAVYDEVCGRGSPRGCAGAAHGWLADQQLELSVLDCLFA
jgi:hypothetical protein